MRIISASNYQAMSRKAANIIAAQVILKPDSVLGLATGSTPIGTYKELIASYNAGDIDFSCVRAANLDEYVGLDRDNDQSYAYFMRQNLFQFVNIKQENTFIPDGTNKDAAAECKRYDDLIKSIGGVDMQLLGIGHNGHIGFNEPADIFKKGTNCVDLTQTTIDANARFFARKEDVPTKAYTMGIQTIMSAKKILLIASGKDKAEIIAKTVSGDITPNVPASVLQLHPDVTIVADEDALSVLAQL